MARSLQVNEFEYAVNAILAEYKDKINVDIQTAAKQVGKQAAKNVRANIKGAGIKGTGAYSKSIASRYEEQGATGATAVVYAKSPHYALTHLLEFGHAKVNGGRTRAFPHWSDAERTAIQEFENAIKEAIE